MPSWKWVAIDFPMRLLTTSGPWACVNTWYKKNTPICTYSYFCNRIFKYINTALNQKEQVFSGQIDQAFNLVSPHLLLIESNVRTNMLANSLSDAIRGSLNLLHSCKSIKQPTNWTVGSAAPKLPIVFAWLSSPRAPQVVH